MLELVWWFYHVDRGVSIICGYSVDLSVKSCIVSACHHQHGDSALMMAARNISTEIISLLMKAGANTDLINKVIICFVVSCMDGSAVLLWGVHHLY